ncbi:MAG: hypothetical protein AMS24_03665 [Chlamydiae bacterium SM23_39]|nr:MAG: hypothetical protein AMS24_03665 [Chlamydiae bacterium SM23_39]
MNVSDSKDTICAIATPLGIGAVSIIRLSGKDSVKIANKIFNKNLYRCNSHTVHFGKILDKNKNIIDRVILILMLSPRSYTKEDVIEIHTHGNILISKKILDLLVERGARLAKPGEFTYRAFINGKIDLTQAEAVQSLISAKNEKALLIAKDHLEGKLSKTISFFKKKLLEIASILDAYIEFPEEELDLNKDKIKKRLYLLKKKMDFLIKTFFYGKKLFDKTSLAIIGTTNVGKSTLMNVLSKKEKAIVTNIHGTTRDILEEEIILNSLNLKLIDTAGIRDTKEEIEEEGIKRSKKILKNSDFFLLLLDAEKGINKDDLSILKMIDLKKTLILWNKIDLKKDPKKLPYDNVYHISAKKNVGIDLLKKKIEKLIMKDLPDKEEVVLIEKRHKEIIKKARDSLENAIKNVEENNFIEIISEDIKISLNYLYSLLKGDLKEDILSTIFSKFCIGK